MLCAGESHIILAMYVSSTLPDGLILDPPSMEPGTTELLLAAMTNNHTQLYYSCPELSIRTPLLTGHFHMSQITHLCTTSLFRTQ